MKVTAIPIIIGEHRVIPKGLVNEPEELEIGGRAEIHPNYSIVQIG